LDRLKRFFLNLRGRLGSYAGCLHCGDRWNWKKEHHTFYDVGRGMIAVCEECFRKLPFDPLLKYHLKVFDIWEKVPTDEQIAKIANHIQER